MTKRYKPNETIYTILKVEGPNDFRFTPPDTFDFEIREEWPRWITRFERYRRIAGITKLEEHNQVKILLKCLGEKGRELLNSFELNENQLNSYEVVKYHFESHFAMKNSMVFRRVKFFKRRQQDGERVAVFIHDLYTLAERCDLGDLKDDLIRDMIVTGLRDGELSEELQMDDNLTLNTALIKILHAEYYKNVVKFGKMNC